MQPNSVRMSATKNVKGMFLVLTLFQAVYLNDPGQTSDDTVVLLTKNKSLIQSFQL